MLPTASAIQQILDFMAFSERLKFELRHSWLSNGRQEDVAAHSYQMALMAMLCHPHLEHPVDITKALKMIIVHDLVEAEVGDVPYTEQTAEVKVLKQKREQAAIEKIRDMLASCCGQEFYDLWYEFENKKTFEAKFANAIDDLEVQIQHNLADISTWQPIEYEMIYTKTGKKAQHDSFLRQLAQAVLENGEAKLLGSGINVKAIREKTGYAA